MLGSDICGLSNSPIFPLTLSDLTDVARNFCQGIQNIKKYFFSLRLKNETTAIWVNTHYLTSFSSDLWKYHGPIWSWLGVRILWTPSSVTSLN